MYRLYVSIEELPEDRRPINITDCIKLHYKVFENKNYSSY